MNEVEEINDKITKEMPQRISESIAFRKSAKLYNVPSDTTVKEIMWFMHYLDKNEVSYNDRPALLLHKELYNEIERNVHFHYPANNPILAYELNMGGFRCFRKES